MGQHAAFGVWFWGCHMTPASPSLVAVWTGLSSIPPVPRVIPALHRSASVDQRPARVYRLHSGLGYGSVRLTPRITELVVLLLCAPNPVTAEAMPLLLIFHA